MSRPRLTYDLALKLEAEINEVQTALSGVASRFSGFAQMEWTGGDSHDPANFRVPCARVAAIRDALKAASDALCAAAHETIMHALDVHETPEAADPVRLSEARRPGLGFGFGDAPSGGAR